MSRIHPTAFPFVPSWELSVVSSNGVRTIEPEFSGMLERQSENGKVTVRSGEICSGIRKHGGVGGGRRIRLYNERKDISSAERYTFSYLKNFLYYTL